MRPKPTIPSVFPHTSVPTSWSKSHPFQFPERASTSPSPSRRATAIISVHAKSAVVSSSTPGVFVAATPRFVHAATSILSNPTATFAAMRSFGAAFRNSSFTFSVSRHTSPSLSFTRCKTSSRGGRSGLAQYSISQLSFRIFRAASNKLCVANTFGFDIRILARNFGKFTLTHRPPPGITQHCSPQELSPPFFSLHPARHHRHRGKSRCRSKNDCREDRRRHSGNGQVHRENRCPWPEGWR